jgi:geranylgeranyl reductase family protein
MKDISDVIVVGGSSCGSFAAFNLAKRGIDVAVFEEHPEIGIPSHCAGHLSIKGLKSLGLYPLPDSIVENVFYGAKFFSPKGKIFAVRFSKPMTCTVDRVLFDKHVAQMAEDAGAAYFLGSHVDSLIVDDASVKGVTIKREDRIENRRARLVVDAEGVSSRLLKQIGLQTFDSSRLVSAVEARVEGVKDVETDVVEVYLGENYCPGFYGWLIPCRNEEAKIGLAVNKGNPRVFLERLVSKHPVASQKLRNARFAHMGFHPITLGGPIQRAYSDGFLAVGDVASQVKPTTGGGVVLGMNCANIAAEVASEALVKGDVSSRFLSAYQKRCNKLLGFDVKMMLRMRRLLDSLSDEDIERAIEMCEKLGLAKTLRNVEEIDFQGKALLRLLQDPRAMWAILYFLRFYLSANP